MHCQKRKRQSTCQPIPACHAIPPPRVRPREKSRLLQIPCLLSAVGKPPTNAAKPSDPNGRTGMKSDFWRGPTAPQIHRQNSQDLAQWGFGRPSLRLGRPQRDRSSTVRAGDLSSRYLNRSTCCRHGGGESGCLADDGFSASVATSRICQTRGRLARSGGLLIPSQAQMDGKV